MIKKVLFLFAFWFSLTLLSIHTKSCFPESKAYICDITFFGYEKTNQVNSSKSLYFDINSIWSLEFCEIPKFEFVSSAYAFTKCVNFQNSYDLTQLELYFNIPIYYNSDTIHKEYNLLKYNGFSNLIDIKKLESCDDSEVEIEFKSDLYQSLVFSKDTFMAYVNVTISNGKNLTDSALIIVNR